jgi:hypothetical protein
LADLIDVLGDAVQVALRLGVAGALALVELFASLGAGLEEQGFGYRADLVAAALDLVQKSATDLTDHFRLLSG